MLAIVATSAVAWLLLVLTAGQTVVGKICTSSSAIESVLKLRADQIEVWITSTSLMLVAMMSPLTIAPLRHLYVHTLRTRRVRARALFLTSYYSIWLVAMLMISLGVGLLDTVAGTNEGNAMAAAVGIAVLWQGTTAKQRTLNRCHSVQALPALGLAADLGSLHYGFLQGINCIASCWALMIIPMTLSQGHLITMVAVASYIVFERSRPPRYARRNNALKASGIGIVLAVLVQVMLQ